MMELPVDNNYIQLLSSTIGTATYNVLGAGITATVLSFNASNGVLITAMGVNGGQMSGSIRALSAVSTSVGGARLDSDAIFVYGAATFAIEDVLVVAPQGMYPLTAIAVVNSHTVFLRNLFIANYSTAILLQGGDDFVVEQANLVGSVDGVVESTGIAAFDTTNTRIENCEIESFLWGMQIDSDQSAVGSEDISIARVEFLNNVIGVLVYDNSSVSISNSLFNVTAPGIGQPSTGVATPDPLLQYNTIGAHIVISHCLFTGLTNGVSAALGHFTVEDSLFNNTDVGFEAADISSMLTDGRSPYVITGCQFSSNAQVAIHIQSPSGLYVIADNVCDGNNQPDISTVPCQQACIIENNSGCTLHTATKKQTKIETIADQ